MLILPAEFFGPSPVLPVASPSQKRVGATKSNADRVELTFVGFAVQSLTMEHFQNTFAGGEFGSFFYPMHHYSLRSRLDPINVMSDYCNASTYNV